MKPYEKHPWRTWIFGSAYEQDERIRSAADRAGFHSFLLLMLVLYGCTAVGLWIRRPGLYIPSGLFCLCGCLIYLFFMVRSSAFSLQFGPKGSKAKYGRFAGAAAIFFLLDFGAHYFLYGNGPESDPLSLAARSLVRFLMWLAGFLLLVKILTAWSNRRIDRRMDKE